MGEEIKRLTQERTEAQSNANAASAEMVAAETERDELQVQLDRAERHMRHTEDMLEGREGRIDGLEYALKAVVEIAIKKGGGR